MPAILMISHRRNTATLNAMTIPNQMVLSVTA
jgi:hypothetical protein